MEERVTSQLLAQPNVTSVEVVTSLTFGAQQTTCCTVEMPNETSVEVVTSLTFGACATNNMLHSRDEEARSISSPLGSCN
jgi:hypothetical protein